MNIITEYEELLIGRRNDFSIKYFIFDKKGNERVALSVIRYAIEYLLGWDVETASELFNPYYVTFMRLDKILDYIDFPSDVEKDDTDYILYLLYPRQIDYDVKKYTLRVYKKVLNNEMRFPKDYMYGYLGMLRAKICLQYSISQNLLFKSADDLYSFFASRSCIKYLKDNKLLQLYTSFYETPLEYMHDSMPRSIKNEFLFHNYMFMQEYDKIINSKKTRRKYNKK